MHMCGAISRSLYNEVLDLNVGILSFAFSGEKEKINKDIVSRKTLEENQKRLGVGFISNTKVEEEKIALSRLTNIAEIVGPENIASIHPDCGFGNTPPEIVVPILENMKKASDKFMLSLQI